ncbi:predicted protein [Nematostella vectensis]|uniref:Uncharacterized protein n=1 Tax=Nematostella vectensis TaxID=45351 RepID=A7SRW0_NEMVE|nr:predicted protein [Nematostella vectensis]|eukprot:XP_001625633.1 predicted protein [Nematostella vectensis]
MVMRLQLSYRWASGNLNPVRCRGLDIFWNYTIWQKLELLIAPNMVLGAPVLWVFNSNVKVVDIKLSSVCLLVRTYYPIPHSAPGIWIVFPCLFIFIERFYMYSKYKSE